MKLNEIHQAPPSFEELLVVMKRWFGLDFGLKMFDISTLHSDPKIAKRLRAVIDSNKIYSTHIL